MKAFEKHFHDLYALSFVTTEGILNQIYNFAWIRYDSTKQDKMPIPVTSDEIFLKTDEALTPYSNSIFDKKALDRYVKGGYGVLDYKDGISKIVSLFETEFVGSTLLFVSFESDWPILKAAIEKAGFDISKIEENLENGSYNIIDLIGLSKRLIDTHIIGKHTLNSLICHLFSPKYDKSSLAKIENETLSFYRPFVSIVALNKLEELYLTDEESKKNHDFSKIKINPVFIEYFPFGKHKGKKLVDMLKTDKAYLMWVLKAIPDVKTKYPNLVYSLSKIINASK